MGSSETESGIPTFSVVAPLYNNVARQPRQPVRTLLGNAVTLERILRGPARRAIGHVRSLRRHAGVFRRAAKSPYRFRFGELWDAGRARPQLLPLLTTVSQDDEWLQFEIEGFRFFWPAKYSAKGLRGIYREVFAEAPCNPHAYEFGRVGIRPGEVVMDGGASEGFFTAYALSRGAGVLAVEPVGALCDALNRTFEREVRQGRVIVLKALLAACAGTRAIEVDPTSVCLTKARANGLESVRAISIDEIISQGVIPRVCFIKMDIENGELEALRGSIRVIQTSKPRLSIAVYHESDNAAAAKRLVLAARPDYRVAFRGVYDHDGCTLRPIMLLAC